MPTSCFPDLLAASACLMTSPVTTAEASKPAGWFGLADDDWIALFNLFLVVFTAVLGVSTVFLWRATKRLAEDAEKATAVATKQAAISEQALIGLERPHLFVVVNEPMRVRGDDRGSSWNLTYHAPFNVANYGRAPADVIWGGSIVTQAAIGPEPPLLDTALLQPLPVGMSRRHEAALPHGMAVDRLGAGEDLTAVGPVFLDSRTSTFLYVILNYRGVGATGEFESVYCWRWDDEAQGWLRLNDDRFNYRT